VSPMSLVEPLDELARKVNPQWHPSARRFLFPCCVCGKRALAREMADGRLNLECSGGCRPDDIISAAALRPPAGPAIDSEDDNFDPPAVESASASHNGASPRSSSKAAIAPPAAAGLKQPILTGNGTPSPIPPSAAIAVPGAISASPPPADRHKPSKLSYAIAYARRGMAVFPLHNIESDRECSCGKLQCSSAGKHPRLNDWQTLATRDEGQIAAWWKQWPDANVGVKCGRESDLTVLDVDGEAGRETLRDLEMENGELPETPIAITGSIGSHYYFKFEEGVGNAVRFAPGLDVRSEGGLVVNVGSITKRLYVWEEAFRLGELTPAKMPGWLADKIKAGDKKQAPSNGKVIVPAVETMIEGSGRHNRMRQLGRSLRAQKFPEEAIAAALRETNNKFGMPLTAGELEPLIRDILTRPDSTGFGALAHSNGTGVFVAEDDYKDRLAVDAYDAYETMLGESREYSWDGLIRDGCTGVLAALIGAGKTTMAMNLARSWALGVSFLERPCRQSKTLVVVSPKEFEAWVQTIGFWGLKNLIYLVESTKAHFRTHEEAVKWFDFLMQRHECRTFILDTLFDFFGMPPNNSGDSNRIAMNEQTPLLQKVRERNYSGLVTEHAPKSEANAINPRDPEEAFGGHTAWTAQHRMRMTIRRKTQGVNSFLTGRGSYVDRGILKEELLRFDEATRLVSLGGLFSERIGEAAMPSMIEALRGFDRPVTVGAVVRATQKSERWVRAGLNAAVKAENSQVKRLKGKATKSGRTPAALYVCDGRPCASR